MNSKQIQIRLRTPLQLFDSRDPAPFIERDLDEDAEDYIVSYAQELPEQSLEIKLHFRERSPELDQPTVEAAIHNYFSYRENLQGLKLQQSFRLGRFAILTGLAILILSLSASHFVPEAGFGGRILREGLIIIGWVAMWRPIDIFLYDWWPQMQHRRLFHRLSKARILFQYDAPRDALQKIPDVS